MKIKYIDVIELGFKERLEDDSAYFAEYGYEYAIIDKHLTELIYLEWEKETQLCKLVRIDGLEEMNIVGQIDIRDLEHLNQVIQFFST